MKDREEAIEGGERHKTDTKTETKYSKIRNTERERRTKTSPLRSSLSCALISHKEYEKLELSWVASLGRDKNLIQIKNITLYRSAV